MTMAITFVGVMLLGAIFDRARGTDPEKLPAKIGGTPYAAALGFLTAWCLTRHLELSMAAAILFALGAKPGWGYVVGGLLYPPAAGGLEKWQVGPLKENLWLAAAARGLMWGLPVALLGYWDENFFLFPLITAYSFVTALLVARHFPHDHRWEWMELLRGSTFPAVALGLYML